jgi:hypothetical protein
MQSRALVDSQKPFTLSSVAIKIICLCVAAAPETLLCFFVMAIEYGRAQGGRKGLLPPFSYLTKIGYVY